MNKLNHMISMHKDGRLQDYLEENPQNGLALYQEAVRSLRNVSDEYKADAEAVLKLLGTPDHLGYGTTTKYFKYPPKVMELEELEAFRDGLNDTISPKIIEIMAQMEVLEEKNKEWDKLIKRLTVAGELDDFGRYFWTLFAELEFGEHDILKKWLRYWVRMDRLLNPKPMYENQKDEFSEDDIQRVKEQRTIEELYNGRLRNIGSRLEGLCPFHEEKSPSFKIYTQTNVFHCYGCGKHGDVIDFYMLRNKCEFRQAMEALL